MQMTYTTRIGRAVASVIALGVMFAAGPALTQNASQNLPAAASPPVSDPASQWSFRFTPYAWLTWMSGSQTTKGRTTDINTNVFQLLGNSNSLIPFMGYFEARYQDRFGLFVDVIYANIATGGSTATSVRVTGAGGRIGATAGISATAAIDYQMVIGQFGGAYEIVKVGPDRSAEGRGMAGVGQTAFDILAGGRYWYEKADLTLNLNANAGIFVGDLERSRDGSRAFAPSGNISWVDPVIGFRIRHRLTPTQELSAQADIGGFGIGSRISWQAIAAYSYEFAKTGSVSWAGVVGYRALYVDYIQGSGNALFETNLLQHGPMIGVSARF
jgi:hypothetical protein